MQVNDAIWGLNHFWHIQASEHFSWPNPTLVTSVRDVDSNLQATVINILSIEEPVPTILNAKLVELQKISIALEQAPDDYPHRWFSPPISKTSLHHLSSLLYIRDSSWITIDIADKGFSPDRCSCYDALLS